MADDDKQTSHDEPDHTEDPRKQATGSGGYTESTPEGSQAGDEPDRTGDKSRRQEGSEGDRSKSTGNPNAAG
jgi:hypothetical protein